jgi:hypothetical protein
MGGWRSGKRWSSRAQRPIENPVGRVQRPKAQQQTTGERYKSPIQSGKCHSCMQHTHTRPVAAAKALPTHALRKYLLREVMVQRPKQTWPIT